MKDDGRQELRELLEALQWVQGITINRRHVTANEQPMIVNIDDNVGKWIDRVERILREIP